MGNFIGKAVANVGRYGAAALLGYEYNEKSKGRDSNIDVKEVHQIVHNIVAMKDVAEKESSGISGAHIAIFSILLAILIAVVVGIVIFCCYQMKSSSAKKAVENYKRDIATN